MFLLHSSFTTAISHTKLGKPIIDSTAENGINIYITEDTELERGITDSIANNFDNIIMKVLFDYLFWITQENDAAVSDKWFMSSNGDYINAETIDKLEFLKYGGEKLNEALNLDLAYECLWNLILNGNDTLTYSRAQVLGHRYEKNPFKDFVEAAEKKIDRKNDEKKTDTRQDIKNADNNNTNNMDTKEGNKADEQPPTSSGKAEFQQEIKPEKKGLTQKMKGKFKKKDSQQESASTPLSKEKPDKTKEEAKQ